MDRIERRRRLSSWLRLTERVLLGIAFLALGWYAAVHIVARLDQAAQNRALDARRSAVTASTSVPPALGSPAGERPPRSPVSRSVVGRIEVPRLGLKAIVREGVDDSTLRRAVGHVPQTALPGEVGNAALAAHRDTYFRPLRHIRKGDRIHVTTADGVHEYRVTETRVVMPDDVSVLGPTMNPTLTLVTCYPFNFVGTAPKRFVVRAETDRPLVAAAGVPTTIVEPVPIKASAAISEPARAASAPRRSARRTGVNKAAKAKPAAGRAKKGAEAPKAKAGPFKKFLQLFTGPPTKSSRGRH